jgi:hypothetical protein
LKTLNLTGNPLYWLSDIQVLRDLSMIRQLRFDDPMYADTPLTLLENYQAYAIRHLPGLKGIDQMKVTAAVRDMTDALYKSKQM